MAEELRWETLFGELADGQTSSNSISEFRNETDEDMFIRHVRESHSVKTAGPGEDSVIELTKANALVSDTDNTPFYVMSTEMGMPSAGATPVDGDVVENKTTLYAKGQVVLEPNESLFVNIRKSSGGLVQYRYNLGYHF